MLACQQKTLIMNDPKTDQFNSVKTYEAPKLIVYGGMAKLTASGTRGAVEKGNASGNAQKRP
jgi:hypothetical protein